MIHYFLKIHFYTLYCEWFESRLKCFDNLISMGLMFILHWMFIIANMRLMNCFLLAWIPYLFFAVFLNSNWSWCYAYNVLNETLVENSHLVLDGVSSMLVFIPEILTSKHVIQSKIKLNDFVWQLSFGEI